MKKVAVLGFAAIALAACTTVWFVAAMKPTNASAFAVFGGWLISPYLAMAAVLLLLQRKGGAPAHWHVIAIVVSIGGILFLADVIFWHPDAQGALAVLMAPLFQAAALVVLLPIALALSRRHDRQP